MRLGTINEEVRATQIRKLSAKIKGQREQRTTRYSKRKSGTKVQNGVSFTEAMLGMMDSMHNKFAKKAGRASGSIYCTDLESQKGARETP